MRRFALAFALACFLPHAARADDNAAPGSPVPALRCTVVGADEIAAILGFAVQAPDPASRAGGICFFASRAVSDEGSASYAIVTAEDLPQRRAFFAVLARRCAGVVPGAPRALACGTYVKLASANDLDDYFDARTGDATAKSVPKLGDAAIATADALYARRGKIVIEAVVMRGQTLDLARSISLARVLFARVVADGVRVRVVQVAWLKSY